MVLIERSYDFKIFAALNREVQMQHAEMYPQIFKDYNEVEVQHAFSQLISKDNVHAYLARKNGNPIAYLILMLVDEKENTFKHSRKFLYLDQLCVLEKERNNGVGSMLMHTALALAKEEKLNSLELDHWYENRVAREFFKKFGFKIIKEKAQRSLV